jgi:hypothetical protein
LTFSLMRDLPGTPSWIALLNQGGPQPTQNDFSPSLHAIGTRNMKP